MGVINLTPDSFSESGKYLKNNNCLDFINEHSDEVDYFDFGALSTAPFNKSISIEEEKSRFNDFREIISETSRKNEVSIDTYRYEVFNSLSNGGSYLWNDVSGVIDTQLEKFLEKDEHTYVFTFTNIPEREKTNSHSSFLSNSCICDLFKKRIDTFLKVWQRYRKDSPILDPGFGFSKSREQNITLLKNLPKLTKQYNYRFLIGLSRKSFLRPKNTPYAADKEKLLSDRQNFWIKYLLNESSNSLIFRVHNPKLLEFPCHNVS